MNDGMEGFFASGQDALAFFRAWQSECDRLTRRAIRTEGPLAYCTIEGLTAVRVKPSRLARWNAWVMENPAAVICGALLPVVVYADVHVLVQWLSR